MPGSRSKLKDGLQEARALIAAGRSGQALYLLQRLCGSHPNSAEALELLGVAAAKGNRPEEALRAFERATIAEPGRVSAHYNYAVLLEKIGNLEEASGEARVVLMLAPQHSGAKALYGRVATRIRDKANHGEGQFVARGVGEDPRKQPPRPAVALICPGCGATNFPTAITCRRCGALIPGDQPVTPIEQPDEP